MIVFFNSAYIVKDRQPITVTVKAPMAAEEFALLFEGWTQPGGKKAQMTSQSFCELLQVENSFKTSIKRMINNNNNNNNGFQLNLIFIQLTLNQFFSDHYMTICYQYIFE